MRIFFIALVSVFFSVSAQFSLKAGMQSASVKTALGAGFTNIAYAIATNLHVLLGFALYGLGAVVWLFVLANWDVSKAYPLVGLGFLFTLLIGMIAGEHVALVRIVGVLLISAGVILVGRS